MAAPSKLSSLVWGVLFNSLYILLISMSTMIFRASSPLSTSVAFVFLFLGETAGTLPLFPFAWRNWTVKTPSRWITFLILGFLINLNFIIWRACADAMPLGVFSAIAGCGFFFAPAITAALQRRCIGRVDALGVVVAIVGLLLVTHPPFLFNHPVNAPAWAYVFAILQAAICLSFPFFFGATADAHWSNFLVLRVICSTLVAAVCFAVSGGVAAFAAAPLTPLADVFLVGVISTIYRLAQQVGCYELEAFDAGLAGTLGNLINSGNIASTALLSMAFFGERLTPLEAVGVAVIFVAIFVVTMAKSFEKRRRKEEEEEEEKGGGGG